jgi:osmotically-inducible protein OsmY
MMSPWAYPENRYYYEWYEQEPPNERSDMEIKQDLLDRLRTGPYEDQLDIDVDVKKAVVILTGEARSTVAKRAAGDDAWDTPGVKDVSNQIVVKGMVAA